VQGALTVGASPVEGLGVFATCSVAPGELILVLDDSRVVDADHPLCPEAGELERHCDFLGGGRTVLMPVPSRYINSSCDPNTVVRTTDGIRHVIALRGIAAGEEITYDYLLNCHGGARWTCRCGSPRCRREVPASFFDLPRDEQLRLLPLLDTWFVEEHAHRIAELSCAGLGDSPK